MKLFAPRIAPISSDIIKTLAAAGDIEVSSRDEAVKDIESVLKQYLTAEREVDEKAKDLLMRTGRSMDEFNRVREQIADHNGIKVGDESLDYILDQIVEIFHHSGNIEEIFAEDVVLRRKMAQVIKKNLSGESELDQAVRAQLRHLKEGTQAWDIEYSRVLGNVKRKMGLA